MNVLNIIKNCLFNEEELEKGSRGIIFIDLDDTCLKDTVSKIFSRLLFLCLPFLFNLTFFSLFFPTQAHPLYIHLLSAPQ